MAASGFLLFAIMVGVGAPSADAFATAFAGGYTPPIPNYGPSLGNWKTVNYGSVPSVGYGGAVSSAGFGGAASSAGFGGAAASAGTGAFAFPSFFPLVPPIPPIPMPNVQQMISQHGIPGGSFQSFTFSSDGKGATIMTNKNGEVEAYEIGKDSPNDKSKIKPVNIKPVESSSSYESDPNSFYTGGSTSSFSSSSDINGKKTQVGGVNMMTNQNGKIQTHSTLYDSRNSEE